jgi:hypothetical protein
MKGAQWCGLSVWMWVRRPARWDGQIRSTGRIKTSRAELELFAQSLGPDDRVALEAGSSTLAIARILEPHVGRVVVANTRKLRQISKAKTDRHAGRADPGAAAGGGLLG